MTASRSAWTLDCLLLALAVAASADRVPPGEYEWLPPRLVADSEEGSTEAA